MGGNGSKEPEKPRAPNLQATSATLGSKIDDLEVKIAKADEEAKQWIAKQGTNATAKSRAMQAIKRKKLYEQQRDQLMGTQFNVESLAFQQEQAGVTLTAVQAMQQATADLKQKTERIGVEQVDKLKDDMQDLAADLQEIQSALAQPSAAGDDDAEKELEALYAMQAEQEEADAMRILAGGGASSAAPARPAASSHAAAAAPVPAPSAPLPS